MRSLVGDCIRTTYERSVHHGRRSLMLQVKINDVLLSSLPSPPSSPPLPEAAGTVGATPRPNAILIFFFFLFNSQRALSKFSPNFRRFTSRDSLFIILWVYMFTLLNIMKLLFVNVLTCLPQNVRSKIRFERFIDFQKNSQQKYTYINHPFADFDE